MTARKRPNRTMRQGLTNFGKASAARRDAGMSSAARLLSNRPAVMLTAPETAKMNLPFVVAADVLGGEPAEALTVTLRVKYPGASVALQQTLVMATDVGLGFASFMVTVPVRSTVLLMAWARDSRGRGFEPDAVAVEIF